MTSGPATEGRQCIARCPNRKSNFFFFLGHPRSFKKSCGCPAKNSSITDSGSVLFLTFNRRDLRVGLQARGDQIDRRHGDRSGRYLNAVAPHPGVAGVGHHRVRVATTAVAVSGRKTMVVVMVVAARRTRRSTS